MLKKLSSLAVLTSIFLLSACTQQSATTQSPQTMSSPSSAVLKSDQKVISNPVPFKELTVPYLRERKYQSKLNDLSRNSENASYTSYLTSYDSDGLNINAQITQPKGEKPTSGWPAVIFVHGYIPPSQYETLTKYVSYVDYLAKSGFVVLKIDLRGHGKSEGEPGGGYYSSDYVIDTLNAYAALQSSDFVDPTKIGIWGHSMAGNIVLRALAAKPDIPAIDIWAGAGYTYQDLHDYRINDQSYRPQPSNSSQQQKRRALFEAHGDFNPDDLFWKEVPPTNYLNDIKGAIQLNHAVDDSVVSINYSRNLNKLLDSTTIPHELHEYPSGGHNISGSSFTKAMQNTVEFYKKYL